VSVIILLMIGLVIWCLWRSMSNLSLHNRARKQQRQLLDLQLEYIRLAHRWAGVSERALSRDEKALEVEELERRWHSSSDDQSGFWA
jgi:hypothetical protein